MYARVTTFHAQPGAIDEAIRIAQDAVLPVARRQQGFKGALALADYTTAKVIGISSPQGWSRPARVELAARCCGAALHSGFITNKEESP